MTGLARLVTLGAGVAGSATAAAVAWTLIKGGGHPPSDPVDPGKGPTQSVVCAAADHVLREVDADACPAGQQRIDLAPAAAAHADILQSRDDTPPAKADELSDLERRLKEVEFAPLFTVVDGKDRPVLEIRPQGLVLYSGGNTPNLAIAAIRATATGAFFRAASTRGPFRATLEVSDTFNGLRLDDGGVPRVELGSRTSPGYSLTFPSLGTPAGPVAGLGESRAGTGVLLVGDAVGRTRASMSIVTGRGEVRVFGESGDALLSLRESGGGGGMLLVGNSKGVPMTKLTNNDNAYGVVLTGPRAGFPLVPRSGLPGSYFLGCAGGDACAP